MGKFLQSNYLPPCSCRVAIVAVGMMLSVLTSAPEAYAARSEGQSTQALRKEESPKVTMTVKNGTLEQVLLQLKQKTNYYILYNSQAVRGIIGLNINVKNASVESVLSTSLSGSEFEYSINNGTIVIRSRKETAAKPTRVEEERAVLAGTVIDKVNGAPMAGVAVYIKGGRGTLTNSEGRYELEMDAKNYGQRVVFSFVGMETQEMAYNKQTTHNVVMVEASHGVDDVVVTGYAPIKKESFTGNSISISKSDLLKASKTNVMKAIQNFDPSFRIRENNTWGSDPNAVPEVYIRGESGVGVKELDRDPYSKASLKDNPNLPLFILDGFEITSQKLYDMDPNRIENITILKDAAATAMYGSRAANGVVVISSVVPQPGKLNISYTMVGDVVTPDLSDYDLLNAAEKLELERRAGFYIAKDPDRDQLAYDREYNAKLASVRKGVDTYWLAKPLRTVFNHKHSLTIDGGNETLRFGFDLQYANKNGVMKGSDRTNIGAGFYLQYNYKNLSIKNYVSFLQTDSQESPYGSFSNFTTALPYDEYLDADGNYVPAMRNWRVGGYTRYENPLYESGLHNYDKTKTQEFIDNLSINWNITQHFLAKAQVSFTKNLDEHTIFLDPLSRRNSELLSLTNLKSGTLNTTSGDNMRYYANLSLSYNRSFNDHNINAQALGELISDASRSFNAVYVGFPSGALNSVNYAQALLNKPTSTNEVRRTVSLMAAVNYSYRNIYLLDLSVRLDGNSAFGKDKRFAPFWSMGIGLNLHKYNFLKESKVINLLKIRGSYGQTGKINFPPYAARTAYRVLSDQWYKTGYGATLMALGNTNLKWETTNTLDVGFELGMWQDRFYLKASYYNKLTVDLVNDVTVPSSTGFTSYRDNIGEIRNRGIELDLRVEAVRNKDWRVIFNANLAHNQNRLMKISESLKKYNRLVEELFNKATTDEADITAPHMQYVEGISQNSIWGMRSLGINPATGEEVFLTKDGRITDKWTASQQQVLGCADPKIQGSFGVNLTWKQFSLYASFLYEAGGQRYNQTLVNKVEGILVYSSNVDRRVLDNCWTEPGQQALYKKISTDRERVEETKPTSRFVQNYNLLSLNSLTIGYDFKRSTIAPLRLSMLRLEIGANDLFHLSSVKQERGLSYPYARTINFSIRASF